jgi:hypothetical protein
MAIPQTDGSGRGFAAHPYARAKSDGKFEYVEVTGKWIIRCRKTRRQVKIVGNRVTYYRKGTGIEAI